MIRRNLNSALCIVSILFVSFIILLPLFPTGVWHASHENLNYVFKLQHFREAFLNGNLYPRWLPDMTGNYGYPEFIYYQPGYYFVALLFSWEPLYPEATMYASLLLLLFLGGLGSFLIGKRSYGNVAGLFAAAVFLFTPYIYVNIWVRGDLSELALMAFSPWPFYFLLGLKDGYAVQFRTFLNYVGLSLSLAICIICHPVGTLLFPTLLGFYALLYLSERKSLLNRSVQLAFAGILTAVILTIPYWEVVLEMKKYGDFESAAFSGYYQAKSHVVYPSQLFSRFWYYGASLPDKSDGMSFALGLPHFLLAVVGFILGRRKRMHSAAFALYLVFIGLMMPFAAYFWETKIFQLYYLQFPWRLLALIAVLQMLAALGIYERFAVRRQKYAPVIFASIAVIIMIAWMPKMFKARTDITYNISDRLSESKGIQAAKFIFFDGKEKLPRWTRLNKLPGPRGSAPLLVLPKGAPASIQRIDRDKRGNHLIKYKITAKQEIRAVINQLYFPGWKVIINGRLVMPDELRRNITEDGRMGVILPAGNEYELEAYFTVKRAVLRNILTVLGTLFIMLFAYWTSLKRHQSQD